MLCCAARRSAAHPQRLQLIRVWLIAEPPSVRSHGIDHGSPATDPSLADRLALNRAHREDRLQLCRGQPKAKTSRSDSIIFSTRWVPTMRSMAKRSDLWNNDRHMGDSAPAIELTISL